LPIDLIFLMYEKSFYLRNTCFPANFIHFVKIVSMGECLGSPCIVLLKFWPQLTIFFAEICHILGGGHKTQGLGGRILRVTPRQQQGHHLRNAGTMHLCIVAARSGDICDNLAFWSIFGCVYPIA